MNTERPSPPENPTPPSKSQKPKMLDRIFRHLPAGSRRVAGAVALGAMEMVSDASLEKADALNQANDLTQEQKKDQLRRDQEAEEATLQTEKLDEIRKKIQKGSEKKSS